MSEVPVQELDSREALNELQQGCVFLRSLDLRSAFVYGDIRTVADGLHQLTRLMELLVHAEIRRERERHGLWPEIKP